MIKLKVKASKELRKLLTEAQKQGFEITETRNGHVRVLWQKECITIFAGTPSCPRSFKNSVAPLKRHPRFEMV